MHGVTSDTQSETLLPLIRSAILRDNTKYSKKQLNILLQAEASHGGQTYKGQLLFRASGVEL